MNDLIQNTVQKIIGYSPKLIGAIFILTIGLWIVNKLGKIAVNRLKRSSFSPELVSFLESLLGITLKVAVFIFAAGVAGFNTSALLGMLAATGFAVGLALQGGLGNFASGILILIFKPYKVGDWIEIEGKFGKVEEIQIFNSLLITPGLKTLVIPNAQMTSHTIINYSKKGKISMEIMIKIPYTESFQKIKLALEKNIGSIEGVLKDPIVSVGIESFEENHIKIGVKPFVNPDNYWEVYYKVTSEIKTTLSQNHITIAHPDGLILGKILE